MVVAILGIVSSIGASIMIQAQRYFIYAKTRTDLQREARAIMYVMTREVRQAQSLSIVISQSSVNSPPMSKITFTKEQGKSMSFYQTGNQLVQLAGNDKTILTTHLAYLAFTFPRSDDMTIISVDVTLQESIYGSKQKTLHMASQKVQVMD